MTGAPNDRHWPLSKRDLAPSWLVAVLLAAFVVLGTLSGLMAVGEEQLVLRNGQPELVPLGEQLPEDVAMAIGDEDITIAELETAVAVLSGLFGITEPDDPEEADTFRRDTAKAIAVSRILSAAADDRGIDVADEKVEEQLRLLVENAYVGDQDAFVATLAEKGVAEDDVRDEIRNQLRNLELFTDVTEDVEEPSTEEARQYFDEFREELVSAERRRISNIVVVSRKDANAILKLARSGQDFSDLARRYSLDNQTRETGGRLGPLAETELEARYAEVAFAADVDVPFGPVQTQSGWNVGVVTEVVPSRALTFDEVADTIKARLYDDARLEMWNDFIAEQIEEADVTYADRYRPADPAAPPADDYIAPPGTPPTED
jgi:peptidyl-prolyl cis-trans isomerase C